MKTTIEETIATTTLSTIRRLQCIIIVLGKVMQRINVMQIIISVKVIVTTITTSTVHRSSYTHINQMHRVLAVLHVIQLITIKTRLHETVIVTLAIKLPMEMLFFIYLLLHMSCTALHHRRLYTQVIVQHILLIITTAILIT